MLDCYSCYDFSMDVDYITIVINAILASCTLGTLIVAVITFRQAKAFEKERTRPMMQAHLRITEDYASHYELAISNVGQTIAHNVCFRFDPPLPELEVIELNERSERSYFNQNLLSIVRERLLCEPIRTWVPGYEITAMFWHPTGNGSATSVEGLPEKMTVEISYTDGHKKPTKYVEVFELNAAILYGIAKPKTSLYRIQKDLQEIHRELKSMREGMGYVSADTSRVY